MSELRDLVIARAARRERITRGHTQEALDETSDESEEEEAPMLAPWRTGPPAQTRRPRIHESVPGDAHLLAMETLQVTLVEEVRRYEAWRDTLYVRGCGPMRLAHYVPPLLRLMRVNQRRAELPFLWVPGPLVGPAVTAMRDHSNLPAPGDAEGSLGQTMDGTFDMD